MAFSQSALFELLDAFRTGDGVDMIRESVRTVLLAVTASLAAATSTDQLADLVSAHGLCRTPDEIAELEAASTSYA